MVRKLPDRLLVKKNIVTTIARVLAEPVCSFSPQTRLNKTVTEEDWAKSSPVHSYTLAGGDFALCKLHTELLDVFELEV